MTHRQILLVIVGLMAGMFLAALDQTVVGTAIRTISDDLDGLSLQAWVTTSYLILSTISTPIYGKLSDLFGRRPLFIIAISIFLVGSLAAAFSTSMYELAVFRAIQGVGAGGLMALPLAIMGDMLPPRDRAKYQGYFLAVFGVSSVVGPLIGGLFAGANSILWITGWRWVFLINIPIGIIALGVVLRFLHLPKRGPRTVRIDWWGAAAVIVALVPLLIVAEEGREWGWASPGALACYIVGAAGIALFITIEHRMGSDALIPLTLFRSSTFSMATVLGVFVGFGMFGALMPIPLYFQLVDGATPTESGFLMLPFILGLMVSSIVSGQVISRTGRYKIFPIVGTALMSAGFYIFTFASADTSAAFMEIGMVLVGLGLGQLMQTLIIACQNSVGPRDMGVATSSSTFFRQIGGTLGTAIIFSILFSRIPQTINDAFGDASVQEGVRAALADPAVTSNPSNAPIVNPLLSGNYSSLTTLLDGDTSFLNSVDPRLAEPFLVGFVNANTSAFWVSVGVLLVAFVLSFFFKAPVLRSQSALEEAAENESTLPGDHDSLTTSSDSVTNSMSDSRAKRSRITAKASGD